MPTVSLSLLVSMQALSTVYEFHSPSLRAKDHVECQSAGRHRNGRLLAIDITIYIFNTCRSSEIPQKIRGHQYFITRLEGSYWGNKCIELFKSVRSSG
ncbi:hypothetical protein BDZ94DRAFT_1263027 [Collybia nuda]|uniref:Uncharacterized protein n=1 Tax=Collybia nuda TaxID=64659 RepID=A0A9P5Y545_9AGAR|nr:hypothetical protein BDZ94DRAFT_1263024 [Collybia nuda]KAF9461803.1 hypothetical protein BDZ94DRAFT_1263027 [Collybia nuda]